jgi:foldase protein PrsA
MGIFGRVPSGGGQGTSRRDRRQAGARGRSKTAARRETEQRAQVFVVAGIILTAIVILSVGVFGYYQTSIQPKHETVLKVGDRDFSMGYVEEWLRFEVHNPSAGQLLQAGAQYVVLQAMMDLETAEVNRIGAAKENISVSEDEIDARIRQDLGISNSADTKAFADAYRNAVHDSGLSPDQYREVVEAKLLEEKVRQNLRSAIPVSGEQVRIRDIRVSTQEEAQKVVDRLTAGEDFAAITAEISTDTGTKDKGGEMGWTPRGALETDSENAVFALEVGQWTQPVASSATGSYYVFQVEEKSASMDVTDEQKQTIENRAFTNWQDQARNQLQIVQPYLTDQKMFNHLVEVTAKEGATITGQ